MTTEQMAALEALKSAFRAALDSMESHETSTEMQDALLEWYRETADEEFTEKVDALEEKFVAEGGEL